MGFIVSWSWSIHDNSLLFQGTFSQILGKSLIACFLSDAARSWGIFLLIHKDFTASSHNGRQHPQLQGSSVSAGPKSSYSLKKFYLENCSQLA